MTFRTVTCQNARDAIRELMALTTAQCFTAYIFTVKYNVLLGLFKFGLGLGRGLKCLTSLNTVGLWTPASLYFHIIPILDSTLTAHTSADAKST